MNSIICEPYRQMCLYMCVMVDQREALAVTTRLTDTVYFGLPYRDSNHQPLEYLLVLLCITQQWTPVPWWCLLQLSGLTVTSYLSQILKCWSFPTR